MTTRELINQYFDTLEELQYLEESELMIADKSLTNYYNKLNALKTELKNISTQLLTKFENVREFQIELERRQNVVDAEIATLRNEINRLHKMQKSNERAKEYMHFLLKSIIKTKGKPNKSGNLEIKTDTARFIIEKPWGGLEIKEESKVPPTYLHTEVKIDKKALRKDVIAQGGITEYAIVERKEVVRMR